MSVKKDDVLEKTDKEAMLAKKTLEHLEVINMAEIILKEKFNGDENSWISALFEALRLKNPLYLMEENKAISIENSLLNCQFDDSFWSKENFENATTTSYQLISTFKRFMTGLNKNAALFNLEHLLPDLNSIEKNIRLYSSTIKPNDVSSEVDDRSSFAQKSIVNEKEIARKPNMNQLCPECNTKISIFNNDIEFSYQLHCQEDAHLKAIAKPVTRVINEQATKVFEKRRPEAEIIMHEDEPAIRRFLNESIKKHSNFMRILSKREFHCSLCDCQISSLQNVEAHVKGTKHTNALKSFETKNKSKSNDNIFKIDHSAIPTKNLF